MAYRVFSYFPSGVIDAVSMPFPPGRFFLPESRARESSPPWINRMISIGTEAALDKLKKEALQVAKEITVKFIETGRISPNNFPEFFDTIYREVLKTISTAEPSGAPGANE
jgi:hypothetical protein